MKRNVEHALALFFSLCLITLVQCCEQANLRGYYICRFAVADYLTNELTCELSLDVMQVPDVRTINEEYYDALYNTCEQHATNDFILQHEIQILNKKRSDRIFRLLTPPQRQRWFCHR